jgi:2-polyprenyl-6-methoxyphenol hydroxylase-like FAD-dependent oxidoreductase
VRICIVGGSIAGCTAGIELTRAGHDVEVWERSRGGLEGRGAGIGTTTETLATLVDRDLVDRDTPRVAVSDLLLVGRRDAADRYGHRALALPLNMVLLNWGDLWRQLRSRVPDEVYIRGRTVTRASREGDRVLVAAANGLADVFDLVLFADGYRSLGRETLFPGADLQYRGYALWRGVLPEVRLSEPEPLDSALFRLHYKGLPGNAVFYFVPGPGGEVATGRRWVNWACYLPVSAEELPAFLVDRDGHHRQHSLPPGTIRRSEERRMKALMAEHLPAYFAEMVCDSSDTFVQPIYSGTVPAYRKDRMALLGDAGTVAPPFTASGVFRAMMNAVDLSGALRSGPSLDGALARWSCDQTERGRRLHALGEQMERAWVWDAPDLSTMGESEARGWWKRSVEFPDEFSYVDEEQ